MIEIKHKITGAVLRTVESDSLRGADLRGLRDADLRDADLRYTDLRYTNLSHADLRDADLRGALMDTPSGKYSWALLPGDVLMYGCVQMPLDAWTDKRIDELCAEHERGASEQWHRIYLRGLVRMLREWQEGEQDD